MEFSMWDEIVENTAETFGMKPDEQERLRTGSIPKLIAAIPFLAGCDDPERTAYSHLASYILAVKVKKISECKSSDNEYLFKRLEMINNFIVGNPEIIKKGMSLLALNMIADYNRDVEEDKRLGKYNPIADGYLNFEKEKNQLIADIEAVDCPEMDLILSVERALSEWWYY